MSSKIELQELNKQLYPTGSVWNFATDSEQSETLVTKFLDGIGNPMVDGQGNQFIQTSDTEASNSKRLINADLKSTIRLYDWIKNILNTNIADNDEFSEEDALNWERNFGLQNNSLLLSERKQAINRKMFFPNGITERGHYQFIQDQLQAAGFDVYITENRFPDGSGGWLVQDPNDLATQPVKYGLATYGVSEYGGVLEGVEYTICANSINEDIDSVFFDKVFSENSYGTAVYGVAKYEVTSQLDRAQQLRYTFFIGGSSFPSVVTVPRNRKDEFRQLILKLKPAHTVAFLYIEYTEPPLIINLLVKDEHDLVQEGVVVKLSDITLGTTDINGEVTISANEDDLITLGLSGFKIKTHTLTASASQGIIMNYIIPTVKIGNQIWSRNMNINNGLNASYPPNGNQGLVPELGYLYTKSSAITHSLLISSFSIPIKTEYETLFSHTGGESIASRELKEVGLTSWDSDLGLDTYGFAWTGAGTYEVIADTYHNYKIANALIVSDLVTNAGYVANHNTNNVIIAGFVSDWAHSVRLLKTTGDTFIFAISVNDNIGNPVVGATVSVEGSDYITDANGQVHINEIKASINYSVVKAGFTTVNSTMDLTANVVEIVSMIAI